MIFDNQWRYSYYDKVSSRNPKTSQQQTEVTEDETQEVSAHKEDDTLKAQTSSSFHIQGAASLNRCLSQGIGNGS